MVVYGWIVMMLSFMVNFLLLLGVNRLCGQPPGGGRVAIAALLGAVHAGLCMLPGFAFLSSTIWRIVFFVLSAVIAYGLRLQAIRLGFVYILLRLALEGIRDGGTWALILGAVVIFLLCIADRKKPLPKYIPVSINHGGKQIQVTALLDTGNTLRDPISGWPVLVVDGQVALQLLELQEKDLVHPLQTMTAGRIPGLRLIPYCAIGQPSGLLLGIKVDRLYIDGKISEAIVAFAPQRIGQGNQFQALLGGTL